MNNSLLQISLVPEIECTNKSSFGAFEKAIPFGLKIWGNWHKKQLQSYYLSVPSLFYPLLEFSCFKDIAIGWW